MDRNSYLERARACRDMAAKMQGEDRQRLLNIADAWTEIAGEDLALQLRQGIDVRPKPPNQN